MPTRNSLCTCGSGSKFKHCCGALSDNAARPSTEELEVLALQADDEGLLAGEEPHQRAFSNVLRVLSKLGVDGVLAGPHAPPIVRRIHAANDRLFRTQDKRSGGVHLGFFLFRDLFCQLYVPIIFGSPVIDFVEHLDLSDDQKRLLGRDEEAMLRLEDQALDLFDFGYGVLEFGSTENVNERSQDLIYRSHVHLEAAAATATTAFDFRGTLQSALIGTELALKAALSCYGYGDDDLRLKIGHDLTKAAKRLVSHSSSFDVDRVLRVVRSFPGLARSRYDGPQPGRIETGHIVMKAQYVASEVTRLFTDRNHREGQSSSRARSYPE